VTINTLNDTNTKQGLKTLTDSSSSRSREGKNPRRFKFTNCINLGSFKITFREEGLGILLGLSMLTLWLIAAQIICVALVPSVNTVSFELDRFVTLRPLRKKMAAQKWNG